MWQNATSPAAEIALRTKVFKICCTSIAMRFHNFFRLIAQLYTLNLILFYFDRNIYKFWPSLAKSLYFSSVKIAKKAVFAMSCEILRKLRCALT